MAIDVRETTDLQEVEQEKTWFWSQAKDKCSPDRESQHCPKPANKDPNLIRNPNGSYFEIYRTENNDVEKRRLNRSRYKLVVVTS